MAGFAQDSLRHSRRRLWALTALLLAVPLLGGAALVLHKVQRERMVQAALVAGNTAFSNGDWQTARQQLGRYLTRHRDDPEILVKYAAAQLNCRPLPMANVYQAAGAYRRILRVRPTDDESFERLAAICQLSANTAELAQIARSRLAAAGADDARALLARGRVEFALRQADQARKTLRKLAELQPSSAAPEYVLVEGLAALIEVETSENSASARQAAIALMDVGLRRFPRAGLLLAQRAGLLAAWALAGTGPQAERDRSDAAACLAAACDPLPDDPRVLLMLAGTAMVLRDLPRAQTLLDHARTLDASLIARHFIDPEIYDAQWFQRCGALAGMSGPPERGAALARDVLANLKQQRSRFEVLPLAIELLARGGEVDAAREALDLFLDQLGKLPEGIIPERRVALLKALVAMSEDKPYDVINLLQPLRHSASFPPQAALLLNEAYVATNQSVRLATDRTVESSGSLVSLSQAKRIVQALSERGAWEAVLATIGSIPDDTVNADADLRVFRLGAYIERAFTRGAPRREMESLVGSLRALRQEFPGRSDVAVLMASALQNLGDNMAAREELERALGECRPVDLLLMALARLELAGRNSKRAIELLAEATRREPRRISAWLNLADLQFDLGKAGDALASLDAALASEAGESPERQRTLRQRRAVLAIARGDRQEGERALRALAAQWPTDVEIHSVLLTLPGALADPIAAQELVDRIKTIEGTAGVRWRFHQARLWLESPDWHSKTRDIRELLGVCIGADPRWQAPILLLGELLQRTGDLAGAEATYRAGLVDAQNLAIADQLLTLLHKQRRFTDASEMIQRMERHLSEQALSARRVTLAVAQGRHSDAIKELEARGAGRYGEPRDLIRLAELIYAERNDAATALARLDEAESKGADPLALARARAAILQNEQQTERALNVLNELVASAGTCDAHLLRGSFLASTGDREGADADFAKVRSLAVDATGFALQGDFFARTSRLNEAIDTWDAGLQRFPGSALLLRGGVKARIMRNLPEDPPVIDKMLAELSVALRSDPELVWLRAEHLYRRDPQNSAAVRELLGEMETAPLASVDVFRGLAKLARRVGDGKLALSLALRGLLFHPADPTLHVIRAEAMLQQRNPRGAREAARSALAADPSNLLAIELIAISARELNDAAGFREPLEALEPVCRNQAQSAAAYALRGRILRMSGDSRGALALFRELRVEMPAAARSVEVLLESAETARDVDDAPAAEDLLREAEAAAPDDRRVYIGWLAHFTKGHRFDELAAFAVSRLDRPEFADLLVAAAAALAEQPRQADIAVRLAKLALRHDPANARAHLLIGNVEYARGRIEPAEAAFRAAIGSDPSAPAPLNNLAWLLAHDLARYPEALALARDAVQRAPNEHTYRDTLAFALSALGNLEDARREYLACLNLLPPSAPQRGEVLLKVARIANRLKDKGPLRPWLQELRQLRGAPFSELTSEDRAALDELIASMGTSQ